MLAKIGAVIVGLMLFNTLVLGSVVMMAQRGTLPDMRLESPVVAAKKVVFYVGVDPWKWCPVGEPRSIGLAIGRPRQWQPIFSIRLNSSLDLQQVRVGP